MTVFENLSDEIIISIIEYLTLEEFTSTFGQLNTRLSCIIYDHPWTDHRLNIRSMNDVSTREKIDFIEKMKLIPRISSISIHPFGIYRNIQIFQETKSLETFQNLKALSLNHITLDEAELLFTSECLSNLHQLSRLRLIFSLGIEQNDYCLRMEKLIGLILIHPSLRHCTLQVARPPDFSQIQSPSSLEYFDITYCSFQSLYTLFEFTPHLRHLTATILIHSEINPEQNSIFPLLTSLKLTLSIPAYDQLKNFLEKCSRLQTFHLVTYAEIEPLTVTETWHKFITEHLSVLTKFKRESSVKQENIAEYIQLYHWPNGWKSKEKCVPHGSNYSRMTLVNVRY
ncbi:hypothetical protein I4U23_012799 [Adineta vaga]|nr:hypothetical protein I4U23_012799 [Adineta vaga]